MTDFRNNLIQGICEGNIINIQYKEICEVEYKCESMLYVRVDIIYMLYDE